MASIKAEIQVTPDVNATVRDLIASIRLDDLKRGNTNFGPPTRKWVTAVGSDEELDADSVLVAKTPYVLRWEWSHLPESVVVKNA